jgi:hypothetical protein
MTTTTLAPAHATFSAITLQPTFGLIGACAWATHSPAA